MKDLEKAVEEISISLSKLEKDREDAIRNSREIIRLTKKAIHSIHMGEMAHDVMEELESRIESCGESNIYQDALGEYSEAAILFSIMMGRDIPTFSELKIPPQAWVIGLADSIGEIRRSILNRLVDSDIETALSLFSDMESMYDALMTFDVPDAILPLRRKQDIARGVMDRTRTDITTAKIMKK